MSVRRRSEVALVGKLKLDGDFRRDLRCHLSISFTARCSPDAGDEAAAHWFAHVPLGHISLHQPPVG